jgi:putative N6-adenine-specific DNA methylase
METFFAVTSPGLEELAAQELRRLGLLPKELPARRPSRVRRYSSAHYDHSHLPGEDSGGVAFEGELADLYRANLHLRTASRVLVRLGEFNATGFAELRKKAGRLAWGRYMAPGQPVDLRVTCHKSRLYHSDAVAERVAGAIGDCLGRPALLQKQDEEQAGQPPQLVVVRLVNDTCAISVDSSGSLLHRRGYRLATAKAPLRETLAAAMLLAAGWDAASPLLDPFCGSGSIAIEAALLARGLPPGRSRRFAFMDWPGYDRKLWEAIRAEVQTRPANELPPIQASDRDAGAIEMARANAERAGVAEFIEFSCQAVSAIQPPEGPGWVVTNPPYGLRVSANRDLRNLYAQLGHVLKAHCMGWHVAILCNDPKLLSQTGLRLDTSFSMVNGGVKVRLARGRVA